LVNARQLLTSGDVRADLQERKEGQAGGSFQKPPSNMATVHKGSTSVFVENKPAARMGDPAMTCNDPADAPNGKVFVPGIDGKPPD
jgi:hypothetical protein